MNSKPYLAPQTPRVPPKRADAKPIQTGHWIDTPEGVRLHLDVAGILPRMAALAIDWMVLLVLYVLLFFVYLSFMELLSSQAMMGVLFIGVFVVIWGYDIVCELLWGGSVGKLAMKLRVVHHNGTPVRWQASVLRNLLRVVDTLPIYYLVGGMAMLMSHRAQRLGDVLAGTLVIHKERSLLDEQRVFTEQIVPCALPSMPYFVVNAQERQLIVQFYERQAELSVERRNELAQELAFLVPVDASLSEQEQADFVRERLCAYAQQILRGGA